MIPSEWCCINPFKGSCLKIEKILNLPSLAKCTKRRLKWKKSGQILRGHNYEGMANGSNVGHLFFRQMFNFSPFTHLCVFYKLNEARSSVPIGWKKHQIRASNSMRKAVWLVNWNSVNKTRLRLNNYISHLRTLLSLAKMGHAIYFRDIEILILFLLFTD